MYKLLNDLKQFFSDFDEEKEIPSIEEFHNNDNTTISLLSHIIPLVKDEDIISDLIDNIRDYAFDIVEDFYGLDVITIMDHWCDMLNALCDQDTLNVIVKLVLLTFLDREEFYFTGTTGPLLNYCNKKTLWFNIVSNYRKIDKFATHWINNNVPYSYFEEEYENDFYYEDYTRFILDCIHIKDKSKARKLRKAYNKNSCIEALFDSLGYSMIQGEFAFIGWIDEQDYNPFYYSVGLETLINGIQELQKIFSISVNHDTEELCDALNIAGEQYINYRLDNLIKRVADKYVTSKEIIL